MNLNFPLDGNNISGLRKFWFIPVTDVESQAGATVTLKSDKLWYIGKTTRFQLSHSEEIENKTHGTLTEVLIKGYIPKRSSTLDITLEQIAGTRNKYLVIYEDQNGYRKLLGTKKQGLVFSWKYASGSTPGDSSGIDFNFSGVVNGQGSFQYTDGIAASDPVPPASSGSTTPVTVKWGTTTIAVANPGETVQINSEFTAEEIIIF